MIQSLGRAMAEEILKGFSDFERDLLNSRLSQLDDISMELKEKVAMEFVESIERKNRGSIGYQGGGNETYPLGSGLSSLNTREPDELAELIQHEHPQTIAIILIHLRPDVAGAILSKLPENIQNQVTLRIAISGKFDMEMVEEINRVFEDILREKQSRKVHEIGGLDCLANMLNQMDARSSQEILENLEDEDPMMAAEVKRRMFVFDDLILIEDRDFQQVLRRVGTRELAIALKAASEQVKEKVLRNMSERAGDILKEEIEIIGPIRLKEVEDAQQLVLKIIQDMEMEGELSVRRRLGEKYVE